MYLIGAHDIEAFYRCRESFRQSNRYCCNREPVYPRIHLDFGSAIHAGCEAFWLGKTYKESFAAAVKRIAEVNVGLLTAKDAETWIRLLNGLPEMLGAYFNRFSPPEEHKLGLPVEYEWSQQISDKVTLVGKIDHVFAEPLTLAEIKTASEIGSWRKNLANQLARGTQLPLYDWELLPDKIIAEVITKPYHGSKAKVVILDITKYIVAGRKRFAEQLRFKCQEMAYWLDNYQQMQPWPMADSWVCSGKYGPCEFMPICLNGETPDVMKGYAIRKEHLKIRSGQCQS